jgi:thioredoxin-related protein
MKWRTFLLLSVLVSSTASAQAMRWAPSYTSGMTEARKSGKLVMLAFYADWCDWSRKMENDTYKSPKIAKAASLIVPVKVNVEGPGKLIAATYNVASYPTVLFVDGHGEVIGKVDGFATPATFAETITKFVAGLKALPAVKAKLDKDPSDPEANAQMACFFSWKGMQLRAQSALARAEAGGYRGRYMADAYNAIGDAHQIAQRFPMAITCFQRASSLAKDSKTRCYALMSLMYCYMSRRQMDNARAIATKLLTMPEADPQSLRLARRILRNQPGGKRIG